MDILKIIGELLGFLIISYFTFYKSFLKKMGDQIAKLVTTREITNIEENIKQDFRKNLEDYKTSLNKEISQQIEILKADLAKENISYQITLAELTKWRFQKVELLFVDLIDMQDYIRKNLFISNTEEDYQKCRKEFNLLYDRANKSSKICHLYITDELLKSITDVLDS